MKKTKIICTLGPVSENKEMMTKLVKAGMNVVRLNFSHGDHAEQTARVNTIRSINEELNTNVGILLDTKGPEIRTHLFDGGKVTVEKGSTVRVATEEVLGTATRFSVTYPGLLNDVEVGGTVLVDDGYLELTVLEKDEANKELVCKAVNTHTIKNRRGINVPGAILNMDFVSPKDKSDIELAAELGLDYIAASFVRRADDVLAIREILKAKGNEKIQIIAKIENQEGVDNLDEIIEVADGVMVARGDLGVEVPAEEVPSIQKELINKCHAQGKIVVTATQMLESMQKNPRPTRAEISDVANAVYDGTDATMLSGESAAGDYPEESVKYMAKINERTEQETNYDAFIETGLSGVFEVDNKVALGLAAAKLALEFGALAIVTVGCKKYAKAVSRFRPVCPVIAATHSGESARALALNYGVHALVGKQEDAMAFINANLDVEAGDLVVVVSDAGLQLVNL